MRKASMAHMRMQGMKEPLADRLLQKEVVGKRSWSVWHLQSSSAHIAYAGIAVGVVATAAVGVLSASSRRSHIMSEAEERVLLLE